jgi:pimeloyl-ACP methyl ester carboxylesterase
MPRTQLLFIPGVACTPALFRPQAEALSAHCDIAYADHQKDGTLGAIAARALASAPPRFALAGLSMGGYIAFEILRQAPQRVERLMLLNTNARADNDEQKAARNQMIDLALGGKFPTILAMQWQRLVDEKRQGDKELRSLVDAMALEGGPDIYALQQRAIMARPDSRPFLAEISCPTGIIVGEGDRITPPKVAEEMRAGIKDAQLTIIPDCGHLSTLEAPEAVTGAMRRWLAF